MTFDPNQKPPIHSAPQAGCTTALNIAGPGHVPDSPQPTPNAALPAINFQSTSAHVRFGTSNLVLKVGGLVRPLENISIILGTIPNKMTRPMDGSHTSMFGKERKERTLEGCAIPVIWRPRPNSRPERKRVVWRAAELASVLACLEDAVALATRLGRKRAATMTMEARRRRVVVVDFEGYTGV